MTKVSRPRFGDPIGQTPNWNPREAPMMPGSPSTPDFPLSIRLQYGVIGALIGTTGSLGSALMSVNLPALQGSLGLDPVEGGWIGAIYAVAGVAMNLLLIKYRQQFGLSSFVRLFLGIYAAAALAQPFFASYQSVLIVRAISGVTGAAMTTFAIFYMFQAFPARFRLVSLVAGIGFVQVGFPLARVISPTLLDLGDWQILFVFEAGLALASLAATEWLPLPQSTRIHVFEKEDALSFVLLASGFALFCAVMAQGRIQWWFEAPWIGWALAGAIVLIVAAAIHEHYRDNPMVDTRWVLTPAFARFGLSVLLVRMLLSEQTFAAPALLQTIGMGPEQMQTLNGIVFFSVLAGIAVSGLLLAISSKSVLVMEGAAPALIAIAAFMDTSSTMLTHPQTFMLSQAILGFAGAMFVCAAFLLGFMMLFARGIGSIVTFIVTFSVAQMLGGLVGPAIFGTFQIIRTQHHLSYLAEQIVGTGPTVANFQGYVRALQASIISDPSLLQVSSLSPVAQQVLQQANILAFNDLFLVIAIAAFTHLVLSIPTINATAKKMRAAAPPRPQSATAKA